MRLWRLSGQAHAEAFDGGYGLLHDGRWNSVGHAVTYAATSPSLCVLEKLVHVEDPLLLPDLVMVRYEAPDDLARASLAPADLPEDWRRDEALTQRLGDRWHRESASPLFLVPSAVVPVRDSPDVNVVINNRHPGAAAIRIHSAEPFVLDPRLF
jgi:RES domain-containing protein